MKYQYSHMQDFLNDDSFVQWVLFDKNRAEWQQYLHENPYKLEMANKARQLILEINLIEEKEISKLNSKKVWDKISNSIEDENFSKTPIVKMWKQAIFKWAASIIILMGMSWLIWNNQAKRPVTYQALVTSIEDQNPLIEQVNNGESAIKVQLEDGSIVTLEKESKLSYPRHFDDNKRTVILSGEAFFEIAKNPNKPFYVYANEVVTKVLGTSFRIQAFDDSKKVIVKVKNGKVSVYNQQRININYPEIEALILLPNQQAIYNRPTEDLNKRLVEKPMPIIGKEINSLPNRFDEVAANTILEVIEQRYGIKIIYNEDLLSNCFITTKLREESLYDQLDLICKIIGGTYKEVDAQIVIETKGCK